MGERKGGAREQSKHKTERLYRLVAAEELNKRREGYGAEKERKGRGGEKLRAPPKKKTRILREYGNMKKMHKMTSYMKRFQTICRGKTAKIYIKN